MEYRGYDSAGIAIVNNGSIAVLKDSGRVDRIAEKISNRMTEGNLGIAHTRWATHGEVSQDNAHPHTSCNGEVAVVHNGIIENFQELVATLKAEGHHFRSQTDSEVIAHLLERSYQRLADPVKALQEALRELIGSYALVVVFHDRPDLMLGARKDAPLIVGVGNGENFIASDILAFIDHTDRVIFLEELEMVTVTSQSVELMKLDGTRIEREITHVAWEAADVSKEEFAHHTLKEIHEQTRSLRTALLQDEESLDSFVSNIKNAKNLYITSCGSSFNIGLLLKHLLTKLCKIPAQAFVSSESDEYIDLMDRDTVVIAISQSGETADLLKAVSDARGRGAKVLSIVNSVGSTLSRKSSVNLYLNCGPEVGVAATKSFTSQLVLVYEVILELQGCTPRGMH
jgi:glucosamine--fructose-6-phosphate aminotransferase (isomerizing)